MTICRPSGGGKSQHRLGYKHRAPNGATLEAKLPTEAYFAPAALRHRRHVELHFKLESTNEKWVKTHERIAFLRAGLTS